MTTLDRSPEAAVIDQVGEHGKGSGTYGRAGLDDQLPTMVGIEELLPSDSPRLAGEDSRHVYAMAELDTPLPPIIVHRATMRVIDGMHRLRVAQLRGEERIQVIFFDGGVEDTFVLAVQLNATHGLPLSKADRAAAAARIIRSHPHWSDRMIASVAGLAAKTVRSLRLCSTEDYPQSNKRVGRDGRIRPLSSAEGRRRAGALMAKRPEASLREIAEEAGIALATTRDVRERLRLGQDPVPPKLREAELRTSRFTAHAETKSPQTDGAAALESLRKDPSLRFTEVGRRLMFLLSIHSIGAQEWQRLSDGVPAHCSPKVAQVARQCAQDWLDFASKAESRGRLAG